MQNLNYGVVGNGRTAALISEKGSVDWLCLPTFDDPSVFAKILDENKGGTLNLSVNSDYNIEQTYIAHTNILQTKYENPDGDAFEVLDFMPLYRTADASHFMPAELYRIIRVLYGKPTITIEFSPKFNYARENALFLINKEQHFIKAYSEKNNKDTIYLYSNLDFEKISRQKEITLTGEHFLLISYVQKLIQIDLERIRLEYERTKVYWMNWSNRSKKFSKYGDYIERSILVLKLMSYRRTGALLAAITTSLPETPGEVRNWDYRYCWLRDAAMSIDTLLQIGHRTSARQFMNFIKNILRSKYDQFQIMYGIRGERLLKETELNHLDGFMNSKPVRIGNAAYKQKQNDTLGYLMDMIYNYYSTFKVPLDEIEDAFEIVKHISRNVMEEWRNPDSGIWEMRGSCKHFVSSKVMSWVALDRASKFADMLHMGDYVALYANEAEKIKYDIHQNGWKENIQSFSQAYDNEYLDASVLLMESYGFIKPEDERYIKTVNTIYDKLRHNGLMYRYNSEDDFGKPSSAFTVCSFWMIRGLYVTGRKKEAQQMFEVLISYANHLKLFSEDIDFKTKTLLGNFPQAYSHLALINTAILFSEEKEVDSFLMP